MCSDSLFYRPRLFQAMPATASPVTANVSKTGVTVFWLTALSVVSVMAVGAALPLSAKGENRAGASLLAAPTEAASPTRATIIKRAAKPFHRMIEEPSNMAITELIPA